MDQTTVQTILDRFEIIDVFNRYARGVDTLNKEMYRSCFTDELDADVMAGESVHLTADAWVDQAISAVGAFKKTQHIITNHTITISGDEAEAVAYVQANHFNDENIWSVWGHYSNKFVRTAEGWKINRLVLTMD